MSKFFNVHVMTDKTFQARQAEVATGGIILGAAATIAFAGLISGARQLAAIVFSSLSEETIEIANENVEATEAPKAEAPKAEAPKAEAPKAEAPAEKPAAKKPAAKKPAAKKPAAKKAA
jgi:hypothetical protein